VVAEYNQLAIWDERVDAQSGCVARDPTCVESLLALAVSSDGREVATAGHDRLVYVYDTRKWVAQTRWRCPVKFAITSLFFSTGSSRDLFVMGLDNEIICGTPPDALAKRKNRKKEGGVGAGSSGSNNDGSTTNDDGKYKTKLQSIHGLGVRGDSRWVGAAHVADGEADNIIAMCESGSLFSIYGAEKMTRGR
jgi:hypothetical protein